MPMSANILGVGSNINQTNITDSNKWEVNIENNKPVVLIPYTINSRSSSSMLLFKTSKREIAKTLQLNKLAQEVEQGRHPIIEKEVDFMQSSLEAVKKWNKTEIILLVEKNEYARKYARQPKRWVNFERNPNGECMAPCVGMYSAEGPQNISSNLEVVFKNNPVASIMHEIGHIIGLRHEHARHDKHKYIDTTFHENSDCVRTGHYDFDSIMHYAVDTFPKNEYIKLSPRFRKLMQDKYGDDVANILNGISRWTGKRAYISQIDIATINVLYRDEFMLKIQQQGDKRNNVCSSSILIFKDQQNSRS